MGLDGESQAVLARGIFGGLEEHFGRRGQRLLWGLMTKRTRVAQQERGQHA